VTVAAQVWARNNSATTIPNTATNLPIRADNLFRKCGLKFSSLKLYYRSHSEGKDQSGFAGVIEKLRGCIGRKRTCLHSSLKKSSCR
jgi:hypothetical protein